MNQKDAYVAPLSEVAGRYWDEQISPMLRDLPDEGRSFLRRKYVSDVALNPEAVRQIRHWWATASAP